MTGKNNFGQEGQGPNWLSEDSRVDWDLFFFDIDTVPLGDLYLVNTAERVDTRVEFRPQPFSRPFSSIAGRNLYRGNQLPMPSGQSLASALLADHPAVCAAVGLDGAYIDTTQTEILDTILKDFPHELVKIKSPLWLYCLCEAQAHDTRHRLGKVASLIVAETIRYLIHRTPNSYFRDRSLIQVAIAKSKEIPGLTGPFAQMTDLLSLV